MRVIGLDVHRSFGQIAILQGKEVRDAGRVAMEREAVLAFAGGDYEACVEWLGRVRHISDRCGGSLAQCDLVQLTFIEAALRARKAHLARALVAERVAQRPASPLNRQLQRRLRRMTATERSLARRPFLEARK